MGIDYTASLFFGAVLTNAEYNRIYSHPDHVDAWHASLGLGPRGTNEIAFIETGAAAYSNEGGQLFIAAKASVVEVTGRDCMLLSHRICPPTERETPTHEAVVKRFVLQHNIPVADFGWFLGMRVH